MQPLLFKVVCNPIKRMMKFKILITLFLGSFVAIGQSTPETVSSVLEISGVDQPIKQIDAIVEAKINEKQGSFEDEADYNKLAKIMRSGFKAGVAMEYYKEYFVKNASEDSLKMVLKMYEDPLFAEMNTLEMAAATSSDEQEMMTFFQGLQSDPPSPERIQDLMALNKEVCSSDMTVKMIRNTLISMAEGANKLLPEEEQLDQEEMKQKMENAFSPAMVEQLNNQILAISLFTYRDVSAEKLQAYVDAWKTPVGRYFVGQYLKAMDYTFSRMGEDLGASLVKDLE